jgi:hypothetical protein
MVVSTESVPLVSDALVSVVEVDVDVSGDAVVVLVVFDSASFPVSVVTNGRPQAIMDSNHPS